MVESLVTLDMPGGGALATVLTLGRRPGVNLEYQGRWDDEGDVGVFRESESSWLCSWSEGFSFSLRPSSLSVSGPRSPDARAMRRGASPVSSPNSLSPGYGSAGSSESKPNSLNTDLRSFLILLIMWNEGGLPDPSRIRSLVLWW